VQWLGEVTHDVDPVTCLHVDYRLDIADSVDLTWISGLSLCDHAVAFVIDLAPGVSLPALKPLL